MKSKMVSLQISTSKKRKSINRKEMNLFKLPVGVQQNIFQFVVCQSSATQVALVCQDFQKLVRDPVSWKGKTIDIDWWDNDFDLERGPDSTSALPVRSLAKLLLTDQLSYVERLSFIVYIGKPINKTLIGDFGSILRGFTRLKRLKWLHFVPIFKGNYDEIGDCHYIFKSWFPALTNLRVFINHGVDVYNGHGTDSLAKISPYVQKLQSLEMYRWISGTLYCDMQVPFNLRLPPTITTMYLDGFTSREWQSYVQKDCPNLHTIIAVSDYDDDTWDLQLQTLRNLFANNPFSNIKRIIFIDDEWDRTIGGLNENNTARDLTAYRDHVWTFRKDFSREGIKGKIFADERWLGSCDIEWDFLRHVHLWKCD